MNKRSHSLGRHRRQLISIHVHSCPTFLMSFPTSFNHRAARYGNASTHTVRSLHLGGKGGSKPNPTHRVDRMAVARER